MNRKAPWIFGCAMKRWDFANVCCKNNAAALVTLHDPSLALNYCDTLLVLSDCGLLGELQPFSTPISKMEPLLSSIYGTISLTTLSTRRGEKRLIMIKEDDAC